jgi:hypothetical protein
MLYGAGKTTVSNNTTFIDSSANAFTVTRNGDTVQSGFNPFSQASSGSGYFDGTGDYLTVTNASALQLNNTTAFTIECWVYPTSLTNDRTMFGTDQTAFRQGLHLVFRNGTIYQGHYASDFSAGTVDINDWDQI